MINMYLEACLVYVLLTTGYGIQLRSSYSAIEKKKIAGTTWEKLADISSV